MQIANLKQRLVICTEEDRPYRW